jgi:hypothetical protein
MPAVDRVIEARGNAEAALIRAQQMALTIGVQAGVFKDIGTYEKGDFDHRFESREVFPSSDIDLANEVKIYTDAGLPVVTALREIAKWPEGKLQQVAADMNEEATAMTIPGKLPVNASEGLRKAATIKAKEIRGDAVQPDIAASLEATVNEGIDQMMRDGRLESFMAKWDGKERGSV